MQTGRAERPKPAAELIVAWPLEAGQVGRYALKSQFKRMRKALRRLKGALVGCCRHRAAVGQGSGGQVERRACRMNMIALVNWLLAEAERQEKALQSA